MKKIYSVILVTIAAWLSLGACTSFGLPGGTPPVMEEEPVSTSTPTAVLLETKMPIPQPTASPTNTANPTESASPTAPPTATQTPTATPGPRFIFQSGTPLGIANFILPEAGCNWMGIGGQAFNLNGEPISSLIVEVGGSIGGQPVSRISLSGSTASFGPGGYVIQVADTPVASDGTLWIRLTGLDGKPLTEPLYITTYGDCERNLILINFAEIPASLVPRVFLPSILLESKSP